MKTCRKCKIEKDFTEFTKDKQNKDGLKYTCKSCSKEYRENNKELIKEHSKEYYKSNKERIKEYYKNNKELIKEQKKQYYKNNKERIKQYRENNKERSKEYRRERRKTDPLFKMSSNLRSRTFQAFKNKGYSKNTKTQEMLGVDWEVCKAHIERQFTKGMKWSNQGEWHIDHIIPLASAKTEEGLKKLCHYSNLQPLWADDNLIKSDKLIGQQNKLRL